MFKFSKKFKLFSNIKKVVSSSLIIGAIFSNVSLSAVSLQEARTFLQSASRIVTKAYNLYRRMGACNYDLNAFIVKSDDFAAVSSNLRQKLTYLEGLSNRLNGDEVGECIQLCNERRQFSLYKSIYTDLMKIERLFLSKYNYDHPNCKRLERLYLKTQRRMDNLRRRIEFSPFNKSRFLLK